METDFRRAQATLQPPVSRLDRFRLCQQVAGADRRSAPVRWGTRRGDTASARQGDPRAWGLRREASARSLCVRV